MNVVRFEPWSVVDLIQRDFNRFNAWRADGDHTKVPDTNWIPAVDIVEKKDFFTMRADLPGVRAEDIEIGVDGDILTVSGERREESDSDEDGRRRVERVSGRFHRRFTLPDTIDAEAIKATTSGGILEVSIPKLAEVKARRITVDAA